MKERVLSGWNFQRVFFLLAGLVLAGISLQDRQWAGMVIGIYFTSMGLFAFGCASGQCNPNRS